jgi:UDP-N-acetylmuramoylalanine--D-glutamate ligase
MLNVQHKYYVIIGLGQTGYSCARFLQAMNAQFCVVDTRSNPPYLQKLRETLPEVSVYLGELQREILQKATDLVVSPGVAIKDHYELRRALRNGAKLSGDIELFCETIESTDVIAITGSNGKSTVTTLTYEMAKAAGIDVAMGGNIGIPVLDLLLDQDKKSLYVLELSSFQLETTHSLKAKVATVLNVSADHMDRYKNMAQYHQAKHRIFTGCEQIVINRDDLLSEPLSEAHVKKWAFSLHSPREHEFGILTENGQTYLAFGSEKLLPTKALKIHGAHNQANALAALAIGTACGFDQDAMLNTLKTFPGLAHRCQFVAAINDISFYNDSKATNVGAAVAAIKGLGESISPGKIVLIAGGYGKGAEFEGLLAPMQQYGRHAVLMGEDAPKIAQVFNGFIPHQHATSLPQAIDLAFESAQQQDAILLAPACASFDMFENFEKRGLAFIEAVELKVGSA